MQRRAFLKSLGLAVASVASGAGIVSCLSSPAPAFAFIEIGGASSAFDPLESWLTQADLDKAYNALVRERAFDLNAYESEWRWVTLDTPFRFIFRNGRYVQMG